MVGGDDWCHPRVKHSDKVVNGLCRLYGKKYRLRIVHFSLKCLNSPGRSALIQEDELQLLNNLYRERFPKVRFFSSKVIFFSF